MHCCHSSMAHSVPTYVYVCMCVCMCVYLGGSPCNNLLPSICIRIFTRSVGLARNCPIAPDNIPVGIAFLGMWKAQGHVSTYTHHTHTHMHHTHTICIYAHNHTCTTHTHYTHTPHTHTYTHTTHTLFLSFHSNTHTSTIHTTFA